MGHSHHSGQKPTENGFHLCFQMSKYKYFSLSIQTMHSLTKLHFPNSSSDVSSTHHTAFLLPLPSLHKCLIPQSANPNLRHSTDACLLPVLKTVTDNSKPKCTVFLFIWRSQMSIQVRQIWEQFSHTLV